MRDDPSFGMLRGLALGIAFGTAAHLLAGGSPWLEMLVANLTEPIGKIFLRLLFMLVLPLVISSLALGIAGLGDLRSLGRIGLKTFVYTVVVSTIAVAIGVGTALVDAGAVAARRFDEITERARQFVAAVAAARSAR